MLTIKWNGKKKRYEVGFNGVKKELTQEQFCAFGSVQNLQHHMKPLASVKS